MSDVLLAAMRLTACDAAAAVAHICNGTLVCCEKMHIFTCIMRMRFFARYQPWLATLTADWQGTRLPYLQQTAYTFFLYKLLTC